MCHSLIRFSLLSAMSSFMRYTTSFILSCLLFFLSFYVECLSNALRKLYLFLKPAINKQKDRRAFSYYIY